MTADPNQLIEELRRSLGKLEMALNAIAQAMLYTNAKGEIQWCNAAFERMAQRRRLELLGTPLKKVMRLETSGKPLPWSKHPANAAARILRDKPLICRWRCGRKTLDVQIFRTPMVKDKDGAGFVFIIRAE
ncbi:MAG: PAS domain-containing protein [Elusimicrobia bacterium]|nr:PAS domain-containing protein [Elusimicrobiota bacterium]